LVSSSDPNEQVKLCFNLNLANFSGLSLETPITTVFSLVKTSFNEENWIASLKQLFVSAHEKKI